MTNPTPEERAARLLKAAWAPMTDRAALIAKLEAATEGSRELDCIIAVHPATPSFGVNKGARVEVLLDASCFGISSPDGERDCADYLPKTNADALGIPYFTTSIDAALTLSSPLGWRGLLESALALLPKLHPEGPLTKDMLACVICSIALKEQRA